MLVRLYIENIALIDKTEIEFGPGLNILTGETGAGKSIVIDSLTAIIGGRFSKDLIRTGTEKAVVEGLFMVNEDKKIIQLKEYGIDIEEDNSILIVREIYQNGKNICRVNGRMVTVSMLKDIGELLVDIHGQHDNQSLLNVQNHIVFLDLFIGQEIDEIKKIYLEKYEKLNSIRDELYGLMGNPEEREREIDLLEYQVNEITSANLKPNEEAELEQKRLHLANSEKLLNSLGRTYELLSSDSENTSILSSLNDSAREMEQISLIDEKYRGAAALFEDICIQLQEISRDIRCWRDEVEFNPELLEQIDERLDLIAKLKRKYGNSIESILEYLNNINCKLDRLLSSENRIAEIKKEVQALSSELLKISGQMSDIRKKFAQVLSKSIENELNDLEMKNTRFIVDINYNDETGNNAIPQFTKNGLDKIEFLISPNIGEEPKPLARIASGGEMSRIMLAIKTILAAIDVKSTLIFDEIDTGISGKAAQAVAEKLSFISFGHQVICVTHLAQIAAMSDFHFNIEKHAVGEKTITNVSLVTGKDEINEIARIIGGKSITDTTLKHAEEIKEQSKKIKAELQKSFRKLIKAGA